MIYLYILCVILLVLLASPPLNGIVYHYYSNYWIFGSFNKILNYSSGIMHTGALATGINLGLFQALSKQDYHVHELAEQLACDERGLRILMNYLVTMDIVQIRFFGKKYALTRSARHFLVPDEKSPGADLTSMILLYWNKLLLPHLTNMESSVKKGGATLQENNAAAHSNPLWAFYAEVTPNLAFSRGKAFAQFASKYIPDKTRKLRILDLAAGSGGYGYAFAEQYSNANVTFIDYANVLETTKKNADSLKLQNKNRFSYVGGDIFKDSLEGPYDLIVASNIYQHFSVDQSIGLTKRLEQVLNPGGYLLVLDFVQSESGQPELLENPIVSELSLLMLLFSEEGQAFTRSDWKRIMESAKCRLVEVKSKFPFPMFYIVGQKEN